MILAKRHKQSPTWVLLIVFAGLLFGSAVLAGDGSNFPYDAPPDGEVGECFARVLVPAQYRTYTEQIVVDEGGSRITVSAPKFGSTHQQYVMRDASVRYEVRQPVYKRVSQQVMVRPGYKTLRVIPGEYRNVSEQVQISPPRLTWKPGASLASKAGVKLTQTRQGEVYCLVEEPGETQTVSKQVQIRADRVEAVDVPPVYRTISREVLVDPGGVREIQIPAQYGSYGIQQLVQPARQISQPMAPQMRSITRKQQISEERFDWVKVLCETNATAKALSEVQGLLHKQGFYQGPVNGKNSRSMEAAIAKYQQQMNITHGGFLSLQTIEHLRSGAQPLPMPASGANENLTQSVPAQYRYQREYEDKRPTEAVDASSWYKAEIDKSSWSATSDDYMQGHLQGSHALSEPSAQIPAATGSGYLSSTAPISPGVQQWHNGRLLSWLGK